MFEESYERLERKRKALMKKMAKIGPVIMASPSHLLVRCGNPICKCKKDPKARHPALHLSWSEKESHSTQYVPVGLKEEVLTWIENYWLLKEYIKEISLVSRQMVRIYVKSKKRKKN